MGIWLTNKPQRICKGNYLEMAKEPKPGELKNMPSVKVTKSETHQWEIFTSVPVFSGRPKSNPSGIKGPYIVAFTLSGAINYFDSICPANQEDGNSYVYLYIPEKKTDDSPTKLKIESRTGIKYLVESNSKGQISLITTDPFIADSFKSSTTLAYNDISPFLSQISFLNDLPLSVSKIDVIELNTGSVRLICLPSPRKGMYPFGREINGIKADVAKLLAEYREAKNASTLPVYQLFCFFKIIDGYLQVKSQRVKDGDNPIRTPEIIEDGPYKGKKYGWFRDFLQKEFRDPFAHFSYGGEMTKISPDNMDNIYLTFEMLPTANSIARKVIKVLIDHDSQSPDTSNLPTN